MQLGMLALMVLVFYFLLIRPQQKRERERESMLKALKRGTVVRTTGGVRGEITDINDRDVTLLISDKVKVNVLRSHIAGAEGADDVAAGGKVDKVGDKKG
jgi:preprotein translocase subunit YajC